MANSTYLALTNELLRRLNQTTVSEADFPSVRSIQATAKDCIRAAVAEISAKEKEWPFQYMSGTQLLVVGQNEYSLPVDCKSPDWESFYIQKDDILGVTTQSLRMISRDEWLQKYRSIDYDNPDGIEPPRYVFDSSVGGVRGFGVTPIPDQAYTVKFEYYALETELSAYSDEVRIPKQYDFVILNGALKHFYMSKDNTQQGQVWMGEFDKTLNQMRHDLIPKKDNMVDTMVNFRGNNRKNTTFGVFNG